MPNEAVLLLRAFDKELPGRTRRFPGRRQVDWSWWEVGGGLLGMDSWDAAVHSFDKSISCETTPCMKGRSMLKAPGCRKGLHSSKSREASLRFPEVIKATLCF